MFWNVLATPAWAILCGGFAVISLLSKVTVPLVGLYSPVKTLKKVVFPAPLGPIKETTPPVGISNETSSTATKPPNLTEILSACNTGLAIINDLQC